MTVSTQGGGSANNRPAEASMTTPNNPTAATPTTETGVAQVEAVPNGERDPAWAAIPRAIDQFVGRVPVVSKHRAVHNTYIAETVARLDEAGDRAAADTIVWLCWFSALDRERERFLNDHNAEATASLRAENERLREALERCAQIVERNLGRQDEKVGDVVIVARRAIALARGATS